jgi:uncharacterized protein YkwD
VKPKKAILALITLAIIQAQAVTAFTDTSNHVYQEAISYIFKQEIVEGYEDGTFKPDSNINRAEFTKIVVGTINKTDLDGKADNCFDDVFEFHWYAKYVCYAKEKNIIDGYDNNTFQANSKINIAEASKILADTYGLNKGERREEWYSPYVSTLEEIQAIPSSLKSLDQEITRGEMAEMIFRLEEGKRNKQTSSLLPDQGIVIKEESPKPTETNEEPEPEANQAQEAKIEQTQTTTYNYECDFLNQDIPSSIDLNQIEQQWLSWINNERENRGLQPYNLNPQLSRTAKIWSEEVKDRGYLDHRRNEGDAYYDYNIITDWFRNLGLEFANNGGYTHTENITWSPFNCESNCTENVISNMQTWGFDYFMAEEGQAYSPHFNSIVSPGFQEVGFGLAVDEGNKYYFTIHYGTEITSNPLPFCA